MTSISPSVHPIFTRRERFGAVPGAGGAVLSLVSEMSPPAQFKTRRVGLNDSAADTCGYTGGREQSRYLNLFVTISVAFSWELSLLSGK